MTLPQNHPSRIELNDEVHARPPEALYAPCHISFLALTSDAATREQQLALLNELITSHGKPPHKTGTNHYSANLGPFRVKWERHTEFSRYMFIVEGEDREPFSTRAIDRVDPAWVARLPGQLLTATNVELIQPKHSSVDYDFLSQRYFHGHGIIGASVSGGAGRAFTDFRIGPDGYSRLLVHQISLQPRQAGRIVQRLLEVDAYRMLALLALPVARELGPILSQCETDLVGITASMVNATEKDEPELLNRLTRLEAEIENRNAKSYYRFAAAAAYYDLVQRRIAELREGRLEGLQQFEEFMERRLAPAMSTCRATAQRLDTLSLRIARATRLLSTKIDFTQEQQNSELLASMNRRAQLQLRLQQTVEGLSVAAVTYYIVGLVGYVAKGLKGAGLRVEPDVVMGISIPFVVLAAAYGVMQVRKHVTLEIDDKRDM
jgi:uncharacterized membrane-anchored protein